MSQLIAPQPAPNASDASPVWPLVIDDLTKFEGPGKLRDLLIADMRSRDEQGRAKYGVPLTAHNGRGHLVDLYQERLDAIVYARAEIEEGDPSGVAAIEYREALVSILRLREALERRARSLRAVQEALAAQGFTFERHTSEALRAIDLGSHLGLQEEDQEELVMWIDEELALTLGEAALACMTVGQLATLVERALAGKAAP